ncbi:amine sulfotransferase-like [Notolabrus celidotus]|uniref:amine sulfotransferase-like n=1 Tax=Notolabrus celidotus TaxID=1203425 RepID=UPI0014907BBF|nr:amine sulfotransferase-like [Notolabrus celidotus]
MDVDEVPTQDYELIPHRGFGLITGIHDADDVDQIYDLEIRDTDVFVITYPKSGTIWMQQILLLLEAEGDVSSISQAGNNSDLVPWMEVKGTREAFITAPSPRLRVSHLPSRFMPAALSTRKGKVIYVARNPKDVLVSYFHFHKVANMLETPKDFNDFFEKFMTDRVFGGSWFEHVKTWYSHRDHMDMLFITYEEMIQDLSSVVQRISSLLGKDLTEEQLASVVKHSTFNNMKKIPQASYQQVSDDLLNHSQGVFMRKGTVGDWKNHFTVAQSERFDELFLREMQDFPVPFIWDIRDMK